MSSHRPVLTAFNQQLIFGSWSRTKSWRWSPLISIKGLTKLRDTMFKCDQRFHSTLHLTFNTFLPRVKSARHLMHATGESKVPFTSQSNLTAPLLYSCYNVIKGFTALCTLLLTHFCLASKVLDIWCTPQASQKFLLQVKAIWQHLYYTLVIRP